MMTQPVHATFAPSKPLVLAGRVVDLDAGVLRDANGGPIALRPQAWAVLALLAREVGRVVTKTELLDTVEVCSLGQITRALQDTVGKFRPLV